jgi:hypothetical protein
MNLVDLKRHGHRGCGVLPLQGKGSGAGHFSQGVALD